MSEFEQYLTSGGKSEVSPGSLRHMGKKAARLYLAEKVPLNDAISSMAKEASLSLEQIKRVAEYANNDTFSVLFKQGASKNITFPMADSSAIAQLVEEEGKDKISTVFMIPKERYIPGQELADLDKAFGYNGIEKTASVDKTAAKQEFLRLHHTAKHLQSDLEVLGTVFKDKLYNLGTLCKEAAREGNYAHVIGAAIEAGGPSPGLVGVISDELGELIEFGQMEKLAMHGMAMQANPISGLTAELEGVSSKLMSTQEAVGRTQMAMSELLGILRGPEGPQGASDLFSGQGGMQMPVGPPQGGGPMPAPMPGGPPMSGMGGGGPMSGMGGGQAMPAPMPGGPPMSGMGGGGMG